MKPETRVEFLKRASAAEYDSLMLAYEETLPRHPFLGEYLIANPVEGVTVVDRKDGLGPRAVDWPEEMPYPDVDAWVAEKETAKAVAEKVKEDRDKAFEKALDALDEKTKEVFLYILGRK